MNKTNGFAISWFFAPYIGSADIDFYKRIKNTNIDYLVAQVAREIRMIAYCVVPERAYRARGDQG